MSPKSSTGSKGRQSQGFFAQAALENLPLEIKVQILSYLPRADLYNLLLTSSSSTSLNEAIAIHMYHKPDFPSTYRFAQFVTTVSHSKRYADMVKILAIPGLTSAWSDLATWREWKYRNQGLFVAEPPLNCWSPNRGYSCRTHPTPCLAFGFKPVCALPTGAVVHVLTACQNIRQIRLNFRHFQTDYRIDSPTYPPTAISSMIFESDIPASWTSDSAETSVVGLDMVIDHLKGLQLLEKLTIRICKGFPITSIADLIHCCSQLTELELIGNGHQYKDLDNCFSGLVKRKEDHSWWFKANTSELTKIKYSMGFRVEESIGIDNNKVA